jgi:hypothetical protein
MENKRYEERVRADCSFGQMYKAVMQELAIALVKDPKLLTASKTDLITTSSMRTEVNITSFRNEEDYRDPLKIS